MITRDDADRTGLGAVRGTLIALTISAAFWALLAGTWLLGVWLRSR